MGQSPEALKQEISAAREDMGQTITAIEDRVSPHRIIERRKSAMKDSLSGISQRVMGTAEHAKDAVASTAGDVKSGAQSKVSGVQDKIASTGDMAHQAQDAAMHQTQGSPLVAGAVAAGIGFVASVLFPGTKTEARAVQQLEDAAQPLVEDLREAGTEALEAVKGQGKESAQQLSDSAKQHAEQVKSNAADVAQDVKADATQTANDVAKDAKSRKP